MLPCMDSKWFIRELILEYQENSLRTLKQTLTLYQMKYYIFERKYNLHISRHRSRKIDKIFK